MIEDWRAYTKKIREQAEGERKHMAQDRERIQEVQAEERALWDTERTALMGTITDQNRRIAELEREVESLRSGGLNSAVASECGIHPEISRGKEAIVMERSSVSIVLNVLMHTHTTWPPRNRDLGKSLVVAAWLNVYHSIWHIRNE